MFIQNRKNKFLYEYEILIVTLLNHILLIYNRYKNHILIEIYLFQDFQFYKKNKWISSTYKAIKKLTNNLCTVKFIYIYHN